MFEGYYIGIGADHHYYTLRAFFSEKVPMFGGGNQFVKRHWHLQNLSQSADEAWEKAKAYALNAGDAPLLGSREKLDDDMREIKRKTAAQLAERAEQIKRDEEAQAARKAEYEAYQIELLEKGVIPFGKYMDSPLAALPVGYVNWLVNQPTEELSKVMLLLIAKLKAEFPEKILPSADPLKHHDAPIGKRLDFEGIVIRAFMVQGFYGPCWFISVVLEDGTLLLQKGSWRADVGDQVKIKATIKSKDWYNGVAQTVINRVKEL